MKRLVLLICLLATVFGVQAARTRYRDFTSTEGKTIRGAVKAYNPQKKIVTIERNNQKISKVPITVFSEADQEYILEWDAEKEFNSNSILKISCDKKRLDQRKEKEWLDITYVGGGTEKELSSETSYESTLYEVSFYSKNESNLKDLRLEYIIYYEQSETSWKKPVTEQKFLKEEMSIPLIEGRKKVSVSTKSVEVYRVNVAQKNWVDGTFRSGGEGDVHGFRARLYMKMPSGKEIMREFCYPAQLPERKFAWKK